LQCFIMQYNAQLLLHPNLSYGIWLFPEKRKGVGSAL
jgi:hypothetical protein